MCSSSTTRIVKAYLVGSHVRVVPYSLQCLPKSFSSERPVSDGIRSVYHELRVYQAIWEVLPSFASYSIQNATTLISPSYSDRPLKSLLLSLTVSKPLSAPWEITIFWKVNAHKLISFSSPYVGPFFYLKLPEHVQRPSRMICLQLVPY